MAPERVGYLVVAELSCGKQGKLTQRTRRYDLGPDPVLVSAMAKTSTMQPVDGGVLFVDAAQPLKPLEYRAEPQWIEESGAYRYSWADDAGPSDWLLCITLPAHYALTALADAAPRPKYVKTKGNRVVAIWRFRPGPARVTFKFSPVPREAFRDRVQGIQRELLLGARAENSAHSPEEVFQMDEESFGDTPVGPEKNLLSGAARAAQLVRGPWQLAALALLLLAGIGSLGVSVPTGVLITSLALSLLVFALLPWEVVIERLPIAAAIVLVILALMPIAGIAGAIILARTPSGGSGLPSAEALRLEQEARQHLVQGYYADALKEAEQLVKLRPDYAVAFRLKGTAHFKLREYSSALTAFQRALEFEPKSTAVLFNKAAVLAMLGDHRGARQIFEELREADPQDMAVRYNLAAVNLLSGDYAAARPEYAVVYRAGGERKPRAALGLGLSEILAAKSGEPVPKGLEYLREAVCLAPRLRGVFLGTLQADAEETYEGYISRLRGLEGREFYDAFLKEIREGKVC